MEKEAARAGLGEMRRDGAGKKENAAPFFAAEGGHLIFFKKRGHNRKDKKTVPCARAGFWGGGEAFWAVRAAGAPCRNCVCACVRVQLAGRKDRKQRQLRVRVCAGADAPFALCGNGRCAWRSRGKGGGVRVWVRARAWPVRGPIRGPALRACAPLSRPAAIGGCRVRTPSPCGAAGCRSETVCARLRPAGPVPGCRARTPSPCGAAGF